MKKRLLPLSLVYLTLLSGCGPKLEEKQRTPVSSPNGEKFHDTIIMNFADDVFAEENRVIRSQSEETLKQVEFLIDIARISKNPAWEKRATLAYQDQEKKLITKKMDYDQSVYLNLVYDQIRQLVNTTVSDTDKKISLDTQKVITFIRTKQTEEFHLYRESSLEKKLNLTKSFLNMLSTEVKKLNILKEFKDSFAAELNKQSETVLADAMDFENRLVRAGSLSESLMAIKSFLEKSEIQLSSEDQSNLNLGIQLSNSLANLNDAPTGLQAIALVWSLLSEQQRKDLIQTSSADLYAFLNNKSKDDIQCLIEKNCRGFKIKIVLNIGVYPAIEKFGFKNIFDLINQKSLHFVLEKTNQVAFEILQNIGETIASQVLATVHQKRTDLGQFKDNLRSHLASGLSSEFGKQKLKIPQIFLVDSQKGLLDFDLQTNYLRSKIKLIPFLKEKNKVIQLQFEILEGILNLPLFSQTPGGKSKVLPSDLTEILLQPKSRQYIKSTSNPKSEVNLKQQSELLATVSSALRETADWRATTFDNGLSSIFADKILTQFSSKDLNRSFFPKSDLVAVLLSIASQVLKTMQGEHSPLVLVDNQNQILSIQKLSDSESGPIALAAATDFKNFIRIPTVGASDMSELLSALIEFYQVTDGVHLTGSQFLKQTNNKDQSLLQELLSARQNIKLLIVACANFISNQLIQKNGLISKSISLNENLKPLEQYDLLDQTRAIEALVQAYELTQIDAYLWTAKNIYQSINRILYSDKIKFYQQITTNTLQNGVENTKLFETYKNILYLKPYLAFDQQTQLEKIFSAWLNF